MLTKSINLLDKQKLPFLCLTELLILFISPAWKSSFLEITLHWTHLGKNRFKGQKTWGSLRNTCLAWVSWGQYGLTHLIKYTSVFCSVRRARDESEHLKPFLAPSCGDRKIDTVVPEVMLRQEMSTNYKMYIQSNILNIKIKYFNLGYHNMMYSPLWKYRNDKANFFCSCCTSKTFVFKIKW